MRRLGITKYHKTVPMIVTLSAAELTEKSCHCFELPEPLEQRAGPQTLLLKQVPFITFPALLLCKYMTLILKIVIKPAAVENNQL